MGYALEQTSDTRLLERAIKERWSIPPAVFRDAPDELYAIVKGGESERNKIAAARALTAMVAQNMDIDNPRAATPTTIVNNTLNVQVVESDDWYGTKAANGQFAASNGAPEAGAAFAGAVQGGGVRSTLGQNGVGTNGHTKGPRPETNGKTGSH